MHHRTSGRREFGGMPLWISLAWTTAMQSMAPKKQPSPPRPFFWMGPGGAPAPRRVPGPAEEDVPSPRASAAGEVRVRATQPDGGGTDVWSARWDHAQFKHIRAVVQMDPTKLPPELEHLQESSPQLAELVCQYPDEFARFLLHV